MDTSKFIEAIKPKPVGLALSLLVTIVLAAYFINEAMAASG